MPRGPQLAFVLVLMLVLAVSPLGDLACGIACMAGTPHSAIRSAMPSAIAQHDCVHAATCCHSSGPTICGATHLLQAIAALPATKTTASHHAAAARLREAESSLPQPVSLAAQRLDRSPPGPATAASPLRI